MEPKWLSKELVIILHQQSLNIFGGSEGIRDMGLLESALSLPLHRHAYEESVNLYDLAAAYCSGILKNHPFLGGNKRAGLLAARTFLFINGYRFQPDEITTVQMIESHAAGHIDEENLAVWIRENTIEL